MTDANQLKAQIIAGADVYQPDPALLQQLNQTVFLPFVGAFATGKTTLMRAIEAQDDDFGMAVGFTTRPRRSGESEDAYDFLEQGSELWPRLHRQIMNGEILQYLPHPTTGELYGSTVATYLKPYAMFAMLPRAYQSFKQLPFKEVLPVAIVSDPEEWQQRVTLRFEDSGGDVHELEKRIDEGIQNLSWCLERRAAVAWLDNSGQPAEDIARPFIDTVRGGDLMAADYSGTIAVGEALLSKMHQLKADIG